MAKRIIFFLPSMATANQPTDQLNQALDPAQLGADESPATAPADDAHDMSPVIADAETGRPFATAPAPATQGSAFDQQRQEGAAAGHPADVGHGQGMGHAEGNGDEDRGYDQSGYRGGLGSSGGREDHPKHPPVGDPNPFTGGYDGGGQHQPPADQTQHLGLHTPAPTQE